MRSTERARGSIEPGVSKGAYHRETHKRLSHRLLAVFIAWFLVFYTITVFLVDPQI